MFYQLVVYVPISHAEKLKNALFDAGAGRYENYDRCCWESLGTGQFRPLFGSDPAIGQHGVLEKVEEVKIETLCHGDVLRAVLNALKETHPYEVPAYGVMELKTIEDF